MSLYRAYRLNLFFLEECIMIQNEDWEKIKNQIRVQFDRDGKKDEFILFFSGIKYIGTDGSSTVYLEVPSAFFKDQLKRKGYVNIILQELKKYTNNDVFVELKSEGIPRFSVV